MPGCRYAVTRGTFSLTSQFWEEGDVYELSVGSIVGAGFEVLSENNWVWGTEFSREIRETERLETIGMVNGYYGDQDSTTTNTNVKFYIMKKF